MAMKQKNGAYLRPAHYHDIYLPKNTAIGIIFGGLSLLFGFAMVWHIWWLAVVSGLSMLASIVVRSFGDDNDYRISAADIERIEDRRFRQLEAAETQNPEPTNLEGGHL